MRRTVLLLASVASAILFVSGVALGQETDTTAPETTLSDWDRPDRYESSTSARFGFSSNENGATSVNCCPTSSVDAYSLTFRGWIS